MKQSIGSRVKEARILAGLSQEELAAQSSLSKKTIARIENDKTVPYGYSVASVSKVLGLDMAELYETHDEKPVQLRWLKMSPFAFLIFPPLGVIAPLLIWYIYKEKAVIIDIIGRKIISAQLQWLAAFAFLYGYFYIPKYFPGVWPTPGTDTMWTLFAALYTINVVLILIMGYIQQGKSKN